MSAFAGIVTFGGPPTDKQSEEQIGRAVTALRKGPVQARRVEGALFVQRVAPPAAAAPDERPINSDERALFVAQARLDNRQELAAALGMSPAALARTADGVLIARMLERWGEAGIARCLGAFAFAQWDTEARRLILGRDCLGGRALFFHRGRDFVAFASTLTTLLALPGVPRAIDEIALANFLVVNPRETRRTFYRGIERVPSRTMIAIDGAEVRHRHYWSPDLDAPPPYRNEQDYVERARELFDRAVADATRDIPHVAISASGGLDSSAIAATVARLGRAESITCYTAVPPAGTQIDVGPLKYMDERDKMDALARMHPTIGLRFIAPEALHPFDEDATRHFARASTPVLGPTTTGFYSFLLDAASAAGHRTLLMGNYGNLGLTWPGRFSLQALLGGGQWRTFAHELSAIARRNGYSLARTFAGEVIRPGLPISLRRITHRLRGRDPNDAAAYSALNPDFVAQCDLARQWQAQEFDPWRGASGWNAPQVRARQMFDRNQVSRDRLATFDEVRGLEIRDPHADRRLLEFLLAVPEPMYRRNGVPRSFARAVLADRLPREILDESRRGAQTVTWFRRLDAKRQDIAMEIERLEGSPLARRMLDLPRLKRLVEQWPADEQAAEKRSYEFRLALDRGVHIGRFIRWVEGGNA